MEKVKLPYGYIYKTLNCANKKIYIGQKKGSFNANYFGSGLLINQAIKKYGKNNFKVTILQLADNQETLNKAELFFIGMFRQSLGKENIYNIAEGGRIFFNSGRTHFQKGFIPWNKGVHRQLNTGRTHYKKGISKPSGMLGKKHSSATLTKMHLAKLGHHVSEETKIKISLANQGRVGPMQGKKFSKEHKIKIGLGNRGKVRSLELRKRISQSVLNYFKKRKNNG
jgi:group I intron endonuclease